LAIDVPVHGRLLLAVLDVVKGDGSRVDAFRPFIHQAASRVQVREVVARLHAVVGIDSSRRLFPPGRMAHKWLAVKKGLRSQVSSWRKGLVPGRASRR